MGELADAITVEGKQTNKRRSRIDEICDQLSDEDRSDFVNALNDKNVPAVAIIRVMKRRGFVLGETTVSNYRRGMYGTK
jgi:hypothetical protein